MRKWRVGTVSMGLMLIVVGILLLVGEVWGLNGAMLIVRWWPVILIVLGIEILVYIFLAKEDQPKIKFDGLSIFLAILVILFSCGVYGISSVLQSGFSAAIFGDLGYYQNQTVVTRNYDIVAAGVKSLQVNNSHGQVSVEHYDGNTIQVDASVIIKNNNEQKARELAEGLIEVVEGEILSVNTRNQNLLGNNRDYQITVNYSIQVPNEMKLDINNKFGETTLEGLKGNVNVLSKFGGIEISNIQGDVQIENSFGETKVKNVGGKVDISSEQGAVALSSKLAVSQDVRINCRFGNVSLSLPRDQQGSFDISSRFGSVAMDDFSAGLNKEEDENKQSIKGVIGKASPQIKVAVEQGDIELIGN